MKRAARRTAGAAALAIGLMVPAAPAFAASDAQACEDAGGTFVKEQGTASCQFPVGNSDNVKTTSQKGSFESSQGETKTNPGGNSLRASREETRCASGEVATGRDYGRSSERPLSFRRISGSNRRSHGRHGR